MGANPDASKWCGAQGWFGVRVARFAQRAVSVCRPASKARTSVAERAARLLASGGDLARIRRRLSDRSRLADRGPAEAFRNAHRLIRLEERLGGLPELDLERHVLASGSALVHIVDWTYWLAQFAVVGAALLWIYLRHNDGYPRLEEHDHRRQHPRPRGLCRLADRAAAASPRARIRRHPRTIRGTRSRLRDRSGARQPVCGDA